MAQILRHYSRNGFEIAIICALPLERSAVEALLDEEYETDGFSYGKAPGDRNGIYYRTVREPAYGAGVYAGYRHD